MKVWLVEMRDHEQAKWEPMFTQGKKISEDENGIVYEWMPFVYDHEYGVSDCRDYARRSYGEDFNPYCFRATQVEFDPEKHVLQKVKIGF